MDNLEKKRLLRIKRFLEEERKSNQNVNECWNLNSIPKNFQNQQNSDFEGVVIRPTQNTLDVMKGKYR